MASQDCPNCHYPAPNRKKPGEGERVPQGMYHAPDRSGEPEECPQCFYQPEAVEEGRRRSVPSASTSPRTGRSGRRPRRTTALGASISRINKNW